MGYVIAGIIVLLLVAGFITFLVMNSMRKRDPVARDSGTAGIGTDPTPLGDTTEHAGQQSERGTTTDDSERNAGEDRGVDPSAQEPAQDTGERPQRPGRPEDRQLTDAGADTGVSAPQPQSERLANRDG
jgi:hypothetical protein